MGASQLCKKLSDYKSEANITKPTCVGFVCIAAPLSGCRVKYLFKIGMLPLLSTTLFTYYLLLITYYFLLLTYYLLLLTFKPFV